MIVAEVVVLLLKTGIVNYSPLKNVVVVVGFVVVVVAVVVVVGVVGTSWQTKTDFNCPFSV